MWETPFNPSMIEDRRGVIIHCPDENLATDLFDILIHYGVGWAEKNPMSDTKWEAHKEKMCYRVTGYRVLHYGRIDIYMKGEFDDHIRCTFYGIDDSDFDAANDNELLDFLGIGGG